MDFCFLFAPGFGALGLMNGGGSRSLNLALDQNTSSDLKKTVAKRCFFFHGLKFQQARIF